MLMLALESSAKAASAALFEDGRLLSFSMQNGGLTHSRTLLPMAEDIFKNMGRDIRELDVIAVAHGPGSFTGLRIGMAEAKGLAWALEKPVIGVSTLEAMAFGGPDMEGTCLCCAMDARRNQVYNALFVIREGKPVRLCDDRAIAIADLENDLAERGGSWVLLGDGAELCARTLDRERVAFHLAPEPLRLQSARGVGLGALDKEPRPGQELLPVYLRLSQAERERQERMNGK